MPRQTRSQFDTSQAPASNPASGINNIPLQGGEGAEAGEGSSIGGGVKPSDCLPILKKIVHASPQSALDYQHDLEGFRDHVKDDTLKQLFDALVSSILTNQEEGKRTSDPRTGEPDPLPQDIAQDLIERIENMTKKSGGDKPPADKGHSAGKPQGSKPKTAPTALGHLKGDGSKQLSTGGPDQAPHTALQSGIPFMPLASAAPSRLAAQGIAVYNYRAAAEQHKKKKKTRGNPFRVLMGQVGKLLDHGLEKRDIMRYLLKRKMFNEETISRCVDVVRDYNRKKNRDGDEDRMSEETKASDPEANIGDPKESDKSSKGGDKSSKGGDKSSKDKKPKVEEDALPVGLPVQRAPQVLQSLASPYYNHRRATAAKETEGGVYGQAPQWDKRSSPELFQRMSYLMDLQDYGKDTLQGSGKKAADTTGAAAELKAVKAELKRRGWDDDELPQKKQTMLNKAEKPRSEK